ncbi:hypothetical protein [Mesorhizobium sp. WSM2239]|uniref:Uncharacterized protein n=2 Tax=unclassified Mesorhizobium TaxID=325217 RepID=A0AAU8D1V1_9HYPH
MGGNDPIFWALLAPRIAAGLSWRIALHHWPASLAVVAAVVWLVL